VLLLLLLGFGLMHLSALVIALQLLQPHLLLLELLLQHSLGCLLQLPVALEASSLPLLLMLLPMIQGLPLLLLMLLLLLLLRLPCELVLQPDALQLLQQLQQLPLLLGMA
jgi:hypothetical protein